MTICCQCNRHYWPGKGACPGPSCRKSVGCGHVPCINCKRYVDIKEKEYGRKES